MKDRVYNARNIEIKKTKMMILVQNYSYRFLFFVISGKQGISTGRKSAKRKGWSRSGGYF